jgi:NADH-quinone oxidoreductase subunit C
LLFVALGVVFLIFPLVLGLFLRPTNPTNQKLTAYECGEPTIGSSYVQFDLRFYVVALLFIIFDVEVAFFFPWSTVFGSSSQLLDPRLTEPARVQLSERLLSHKPGTLPVAEAITPEAAKSVVITGLIDIVLFCSWPSPTCGSAATSTGSGPSAVSRGPGPWGAPQPTSRPPPAASSNRSHSHTSYGFQSIRASIFVSTEVHTTKHRITDEPAPSMTPAEIQQALAARFGDKITGANLEALDPWIEVAPAAIAEVAGFLKNDPALAFDALNNLSAVDYFEPDAKKQAKFGHEPHVEVVYHLYSYTNRHWIVIKTKLPRWRNNQPGVLPDLPTVSGVWAIADWHEREAFDLMGINFVGHPGPRRILCSEDWVGHALRKDYEFPLEYHGIRGR